jgi:hypothetical protein
MATENELAKPILEQYQKWGVASGDPLTPKQARDIPSRSFEVFLKDLKAMEELLDITAPLAFDGDQRRFGGLIGFIKRHAFKLARPLFRLFLLRQVMLNRLFHAMAFRIAALEMKVNELENKTVGSNHDS